MNRVKGFIVGVTLAALSIGSVAALSACSTLWNENAAAQVVLGAEAQEAVLEALVGPEGEYAAYATYTAILDVYGQVNPFANIMASEAKHIDALKRVLDSYGVAYPDENPYLGVVEAPASLAAAAQAGVDAEIANVALYEEQLAAVADYPDIVEVFVSLQAASQENHLPAFERAAARY